LHCVGFIGFGVDVAEPMTLWPRDTLGLGIWG
jgi:hypothetical protein